MRLLGRVEEYFGMTQLNIRRSVGGQQIVLRSGDQLPSPATIPTGDFITGYTAEAYESVFIEFTSATVTDPDLGFGEWAFDDGSGATRADDAGNADGDLTYAPALGDTYAWIMGIGWYSFDDFKLQPRSDDDILLEVDSPNIEKAAPANAQPGSIFTYTVTVKNYLGLTLNDLVVTDAVPSNVELAAILDGGQLVPGNVVSWTLPTLPDKGIETFRFVVTAPITLAAQVWNTDFAVWAANWITPTQGLPVLTVVGDYTPIYLIQGDGFESPFNGRTAKTVGIVTGFFKGNMPSSGVYDGFYIQDPAGDGDPDTSDGLFVNHGTASVAVTVGDLVTVTGVVQEFNEYGDPCPACETQIMVASSADVVIGPNVGAPAATELMPDGTPLYLEAHEGMLATVSITAPVVGPTNYGTFMVIRGDEGVDRVMRGSPQDGKAFGVRNYLRYGSGGPNLIVGSVVTTGIDGPLAFSYSNYLVALQDLGALFYASKEAPAEPPTWPAPGANQFNVATFNAYNFDSLGTHLTKVVSTLVQMNGPTFLSLQEIDVATVVTDVINSLATAGYAYDYAYSHPDVGGHGVAVLWRTDQVSNVVWSTQYQGCSPYGSSSSTYDPLWSTCQAQGEFPLFSRRPVVVTGTLDAGGVPRPVVVIGNHFKSKLGGLPSDMRRLEQAQFVGTLVDGFVAGGVQNVLVMGDLNDFEDSAPLQALYASGNLTNTWFTLPGRRVVQLHLPWHVADPRSRTCLTRAHVTPGGSLAAAHERRLSISPLLGRRHGGLEHVRSRPGGCNL